MQLTTAAHHIINIHQSHTILTNIRKYTGNNLIDMVDTLIRQLHSYVEAGEVAVRQIGAGGETISPQSRLQGGQDGSSGLVTQ